MELSSSCRPSPSGRTKSPLASGTQGTRPVRLRAPRAGGIQSDPIHLRWFPSFAPRSGDTDSQWIWARCRNPTRAAWSDAWGQISGFWIWRSFGWWVHGSCTIQPVGRCRSAAAVARLGARCHKGSRGAKALEREVPGGENSGKSPCKSRNQRSDPLLSMNLNGGAGVRSRCVWRPRAAPPGASPTRRRRRWRSAPPRSTVSPQPAQPPTPR